MTDEWNVLEDGAEYWDRMDDPFALPTGIFTPAPISAHERNQADCFVDCVDDDAAMVCVAADGTERRWRYDDATDTWDELIDTTGQVVERRALPASGAQRSAGEGDG